MPDIAGRLGATKAESTLLVLFIPSKDRSDKLLPLREFLHRMGQEARQGAIGLVIDRDYLEIGFPLEKPASPARPKKGKR